MTRPNERLAVLLMAYGTPNSPADIEPYYTDIRGGHKPSPENLAELIARYERIGGRTPLLEITRAQAHALQAQLGENYCVYIGMKHWHPFLAQAVDEIAHERHARAIAVALAPHYSRFSIDGYIQRVRDAVARQNKPLDVTFVESWNDHPLLVQSIVERMEEARRAWGSPEWSDLQVVFTAHSLPERIIAVGDPYPVELRETAERVAARLGLAPDKWQLSYQSAGRTREKWLGPDILDTLDTLASNGRSRVLVAPIGFVADHLEILYDIDVEAVERARALGLDLRRIPSANATPTFISALADVVRTHTPQAN